MRQDDVLHATTDDLSPLASRVLKLNAGSAYMRLVLTGPGNAEARTMLEKVAAADLFTASPASGADAAGVLAGLWLWHDWLADAHTIAQSLSSATGSFWHAIMHRREGDFSNGKYWYARCADHPVLASLGAHAAAMLNPFPADNLLLRLIANGWNGAAFVDLVEQVHKDGSDPRAQAAVLLQQLEWRVLFNHCVRAAMGK